MNSYININIKAKDSIILTPQPETLTQVPGAPRWFILRVWFPLDLLRRGLPNPVQLSGSFHPDLFLLSPEPALSPATVYRLPPIHPTWRLGRPLDLGYPVIRLLTSPWSPPRSFLRLLGLSTSIVPAASRILMSVWILSTSIVCSVCVATSLPVIIFLMALDSAARSRSKPYFPRNSTTSRSRFWFAEKSVQRVSARHHSFPSNASTSCSKRRSSTPSSY